MMRKVERSSVAAPASLTDPSAAVLSERSAAVTHYAAGLPDAAYGFSQYKGYDVKSALRKLFKSKCAYCEFHFIDAMDVEHFRPKGGVEGEPLHPGYWWLALQWDNLLPSCVGCNQRRKQHLVTVNTTELEYAAFQSKNPRKSAGKGNHFPVSGTRAFGPADSLSAETHDIIDPTVDDPELFLSWSTTSTFSVVLPPIAPSSPAHTKRGLATINVFALNRTTLVQLRTEVLRELRLQAVEIERDLEEDAVHGGSAFAVGNALRRVGALKRFCAPEKPFSAMATVFVEEFADRLLKRVSQAHGAPGQAGTPNLPQPAE